MMAGTRCLPIGILAVCLSAVPDAQAPEPDPLRRLLAEAFGVTPAELARANSGQAISRTMPVGDSREVATFGMVRMKIPAEFFVEQLKDIVSFKQADAVLQIGVFGNPPDIRDIRGLTLDDSDVDALKQCRLGDCAVQLPADLIERLRTDVRWNQPDASQRATELFARALVAYVAEYERIGKAAPMRYADHSRVIDVPKEFASLAEVNESVWRQVPVLRRHLHAYPSIPENSSSDILYWSKEKLGRKPVVSVTHLAIVRALRDGVMEYAIASRNLYGSHYLDASLALTILLRDRSATDPATYVAYLNRSRVDVFGGIFGGMIRKIVTSRARGAAVNYLDALRRRLETQFAARQTS